MTALERVRAAAQEIDDSGTIPGSSSTLAERLISAFPELASLDPRVLVLVCVALEEAIDSAEHWVDPGNRTALIGEMHRVLGLYVRTLRKDTE